VIRLDCAQSVLAAIFGFIVTQYNVVQTAALMYLCEKFYEISRNTVKKLSAYGKSQNQCNTSFQQVLTLSLISQKYFLPGTGLQTEN
jgi:hypothetical protein